MMPIQEFIEKMSFCFQTKGYEEFKGTNLLISIEFIGRLTNKSMTIYKVNVNNVIQSMQSKEIKFMSLLTIGSEERAGEEWNISELIENKILQQPADYISYQNNMESTSIKFMNYKLRFLDDTDSVTSDKDPIENRRHSVSEFMEKPDLDIEISYCKDKLKNISMEYNSTMICEWSTLRENELYFYIELSRLQVLKKNKEAIIEHLETKKNMVILVENKPEEINDKERQNNEDEQWEINKKILSDNFEEKEEEEFINETIKQIFDYDALEQLKESMDSLDDKGIHNLDNATEAMEVDFRKSKRAK
jgi:hypothetical protein